jgi:hypothetical protein
MHGLTNDSLMLDAFHNSPISKLKLLEQNCTTTAPSWRPKNPKTKNSSPSLNLNTKTGKLISMGTNLKTPLRSPKTKTLPSQQQQTHLPKVINVVKVIKKALKSRPTQHLKPPTNPNPNPRTLNNPSPPGLAGFGTLDTLKLDSGPIPIFVHRLASETSEYGLMYIFLYFFLMGKKVWEQLALW